MSQNTLINVGVGVALAAATYFTLGASAALFAFSIGATVSALILGPDDPKGGNKGPKPDKLEFNQSEENTTIPVVFGTTRVPANFIRLDRSQFRSKPIKKKGEGKDAKSEVVGFTYTMPIAYGLCMGKIDRLIRVVGSPGLDRMTTLDPAGLAFGDQPATFEIIHKKTENKTTTIEGGSATFYPGSRFQGGSTADMNHRNVCWVNFPSYRIDGSTVPRSLLFEVQRMPVVLDAAGNPIAGFPLRASWNSNAAEYADANPAAVAWEVLTNKLWGKGLSPDILDQESFIAAATYFASNELGISTAMGRTSLSGFMQMLRDLFGLLIFSDGIKLRALCLYDPIAAYQTKVRIQTDDVIDAPEFTRPSSSSSHNEIRLEFTNRQNNWQSEIASQMDLAHVQTIGGIRSQAVDGREIGTRQAAEKIAGQILRMLAYPPASMTLKLRRPYSGLMPGTFVEFLWDEWRTTGLATTYWRVIDVEDDDQTADGLTVNLQEDIYSFARDGAPDGWTTPRSLIGQDNALANGDFTGGDLTTEQDAGSLLPVFLWEPNIFITGGTRAILVLPTKRAAIVQATSLAWSYEGALTTEQLEASETLPINGILLTGLTETGPTLCRGAATELQILLEVPEDAAAFEAATGLVQTASDHFDALLRTSQAFLLLGTEIIRVGDAEETAPGTITIRNYVRGEMGTEKANHDPGETCSFLDTIENGTFTPAAAIPTTASVQIHATPIGTRPNINATTEIIPTGAGVVFPGRSIRPFKPSLVAATKAADEWTITIRPRMWAIGAGTGGTIEDELNALILDLPGLGLRFQPDNGPTVDLPSASGSFTSPPFQMPPDIEITSLAWNPGAGTITTKITLPTTPTILRIWSVRSGQLSDTALEIPTP